MITFAKVKKIHWLISLVVVAALALATAAYQVKVARAELEKAQSTAQQALDLHEGQAKINQALTALVKENNTKLEVYLELMGFDQDEARRWAALPREPEMDSLGRIYLDRPWLYIGEALELGVMFIVRRDPATASARIFVDTLWGARVK